MKKLLALLLLSPFVVSDYKVTWINHNGSSIAVNTFVLKDSFSSLADCESKLDDVAKNNYSQFDFQVKTENYWKSGDMFLQEERKVYFSKKRNSNDIKAQLMCLDY